MIYSYLGQNLHETADRSRKYFAGNYGAKNFECEKALNADLPLRPTLQATMNAGYKLCIEVRETPFSPSLYQFVTECANHGIPVRLWVVIPPGPAGPTFNAELKQARDVGVGVAQIGTNGSVHEFHKPVPLSLFALTKTDLAAAPKSKREALKAAEDIFLGGAPDQGCQAICQELELVTRQVAEFTYSAGLWKTPKGAPTHNARFFRTDSWARMLDALDGRIDVKRVGAKSPTFSKALVAGARHFTDWRNSVSHKPKTLKQLQQRDAKLRTMFEATRDLLIAWYDVAKPFKLL
jgi:hypothetical protein